MRDAGLRVAGAVVVYRLYDVGYEIDLDRASDLLATSPRERATVRRPLQSLSDLAADLESVDRPIGKRPTRTEAQTIQIPHPPITRALGGDTITLGAGAYCVLVSARIFDFGVISLRLRVEAPGVLSWQEYTALGNAIDVAIPASGMFERYLHSLTTSIRGAVARPQLAPVTEDYVVYRIARLLGPADEPLPSAVLRDLDIVPLLLNEQRTLADQARRDLLPYWFSYYPDDLAVLTWSSALIVDPAEGESDVQVILEFANAQLLELRYYDALLDAELPKMYDRIADRRRGSRALFGRRYASLLTALQTLVADSTEIVERAENALKVTEDVYLARVYAAALELFRGRVWRGGIDHKLAIIRQTYAMLNAESMTVRNEVLEVAIVVLIVVEIVIAVVLGRR